MGWTLLGVVHPNKYEEGSLKESMDMFRGKLITNAAVKKSDLSQDEEKK